MKICALPSPDDTIPSIRIGRRKYLSLMTVLQSSKTTCRPTTWPGTLNVKVEGESLIEYRKLRVSAGLDEGTESGAIAHRIKGFDRDGVSFGGATAFLAQFIVDETSHDCAILIPDLTRHEDVVEVIAGVFLRESCSIQDGDTVSIFLE